MSRLVTFVVGLTVLGAAFPGNPASTVRVWAYQPLSLDFRLNHVAVVGDSYTTGTDLGGEGRSSWTARAWEMLARHGVRIAADVAAEGKAGYGAPGDHGSVFEDLTARAAKPGDVLVVFFGSRNDQGVEPTVLAQKARDTFDLARRFAPSARFLVIGPPWPTPDVPAPVLQIRDVLFGAARDVGAVWVDPIFEHWFLDKPGLIGPDGVHPNDAGHAYLAEKIAPLIDAQLRR